MSVSFAGPHRLKQLVRHFGVDWLAYRALYTLQRKIGLLEFHLPRHDWGARALNRLISAPRLADLKSYHAYRVSSPPPFFFRPSDRLAWAPHFAAWDVTGESPHAEAQAVADGSFLLFRRQAVALGQAPNWHQNPLTGHTIPSGPHWSRIGDFGHGDIKAVWELGRFGFTYALVRAYWRTGDERWAEVFWRLVESWREANRPQQGAHWKCGQEASFRLMAWCFGLYGFLDCQATTPERVVQVLQLAAVTGERIEANLSYALSQQNNHGISEGLGLWTIGLLFPELARAGHWRERGRQILEQLGRELIYEDGAFCQHSFVYQRLMLQDYLWCCRLGEIHQEPLSEELRARLAKSAEVLFQAQDESTGRLPNYGANDGSLILPLDNSDYQDFRPVVQATAFLTRRERWYPPGSWDEGLLWLFGPNALERHLVPPARRDFHAPAGGLAVLRSSTGLAFIHGGPFRHRPGHADLLHVDLWWRGCNVALDAGTYSYNPARPEDGGLSGTRCHNTVTVDGLDQMDKAGRFLWLPWANAEGGWRTVSTPDVGATWEGKHAGYGRLRFPVTHRRAVVRLGAEHWLILDRVVSKGPHSYRLHWLLPDCSHRWVSNQVLELDMPPGPYCIHLGATVPGEVSLVCGEEKTGVGWQSRYYFQRSAALSLSYSVSASVVDFWTVFGPPPVKVEADSEGVVVQTGEGLTRAAWTGASAEFLVRAVEFCLADR